MNTINAQSHRVNNIIRQCDDQYCFEDWRYGTIKHWEYLYYDASTLCKDLYKDTQYDTIALFEDQYYHTITLCYYYWYSEAKNVIKIGMKAHCVNIAITAKSFNMRIGITT